MKHQFLPSPPLRDELRELPQAPRMLIEISRLLRYRAREGVEDVMAQHSARLVMSHLATKGALSQLELVNLTRLKAPTVSVLLRQMEKEGYVARTPSDKDRRVMLVTLTERGREFDRERLARISLNDKTAMQGFTKEEEALFLQFLTRMCENLTKE
jgi:DNA-binding MarR family transcriptional regulator